MEAVAASAPAVASLPLLCRPKGKGESQVLLVTCWVHVIGVKIASAEGCNQAGRVTPVVGMWRCGDPAVVLYLGRNVLCLINPCSAQDHQATQRRPR